MGAHSHLSGVWSTDQLQSTTRSSRGETVAQQSSWPSGRVHWLTYSLRRGLASLVKITTVWCYYGWTSQEIGHFKKANTTRVLLSSHTRPCGEVLNSEAKTQSITTMAKL
uniref:Uncharacterized protein n=1 Tax=Strigamia maritima TaxID=126957 RepID=T1J8J7_STRMM